MTMAEIQLVPNALGNTVVALDSGTGGKPPNSVETVDCYAFTRTEILLKGLRVRQGFSQQAWA
jgi:hypothetical protein